MPTEWIVIAVLAVIAIYVIVVFNRLIRGRNLVREGWSGIDVQLRRRSDSPVAPDISRDKMRWVESEGRPQRGNHEPLPPQSGSSACRRLSAGVAGRGMGRDA